MKRTQTIYIPQQQLHSLVTTTRRMRARYDFFFVRLRRESQALLDLRNSQRRVQPFRARPTAVQDRVASVQAHAVLERLLPLVRPLISRVGNPPVTLQQHSRTKVLLAVPPVAWARRRAASAKNALVQSVQLTAVFLRLAILAAIGWRGVALEVGLDGFVLLVELGQVGHEVLDNVGVRERVDAGLLLGVNWDAAWSFHISRMFGDGEA